MRVLSAPLASPSFSNNISISDGSAHYEKTFSRYQGNKIDIRRVNLELYLEKRNSPLTPYVDDLIIAADVYGLDYRLIPAISGIESGFCLHIPTGSYNCWGWNNGLHRFDSYRDAIYIIAKALKLNYIDKGYKTLSQISPVYAPPSNTWADKVGNFMIEIDSHANQFSLLQITI